MKCTIIRALPGVCRIKVSVTMFCVFNIISAAPGAQGGLILAQVPLWHCTNTNLNGWRADESRRVNAWKTPGWFPVWPDQFSWASGFYTTCWHNMFEWDVIASDAFAEVTIVTSWSESPTTEELPQLLFGVSAPPVPQGEERRQCMCTALTQSAPVYAARVCFPHYGLFHLPEGTEYSFPLCHK